MISLPRSQPYSKNSVYICDCQNNNSTPVRKRVVSLLRHNFDYGLLKVKTLQRRFPIEKETWQSLLIDAPKNFNSLSRLIQSDLLIWIKTDKLCNRLKLKILSKRNKLNEFDVRDFPFTELEPLSVERLYQYSHLLALFTFAHMGSGYRDKIFTQKKYLEKLTALSRNLDNDLSSLETNMPAQFSRTLQHLQAWVWFISGTFEGDNAKLGRALRSYEKLLAKYQDSYNKFEYGQVLSNIAALKFEIAKISTGLEAYEQTLDAVNDAHAVFDRVKHPMFWVNLQEIKALAQSSLAERSHDSSYLEQAIHSLQTIRRIHITQGQQSEAAHTQKRIGDCLRTLGHQTLGMERYEQAISAYYTALNFYDDHQDGEAAGKTHLALAQTLVDISERNGSQDNLHQAITHSRRCREKLPHSKKLRLAANISEAQALIQLGGSQTKDSLVERYLHEGLNLLTKRIRISQKHPVSDKVRCMDLLGTCYALLAKHKDSKFLMAQSCDSYRQGIDAIDNNSLNQNTIDKATIARLYGQLARNYSWLCRFDYSNSNIDKAVSAYRSSVSLTDRDTATQDWAILNAELAQLLVFKTKRDSENGPRLLEESIKYYRESLANLRRQNSPLLWAQIRHKLGEALALSGAMGSGTPYLELAIDSYEKALEEWKPQISPQDRAITLNNMANVLADIARREENEDKLFDAKKALSEAHDLLSCIGNRNFAERVSHNMNVIDSLLQVDSTNKDIDFNYNKTGISGHILH